jgi:outer membrane protein TolC
MTSYRGILPTVRLEGGYTATTDPLGAFGFLLRQREVTPAAFAPERLNHPDPVHNVSAGVVLEQPILNPDAWLGRRAAARATEAARAGAEWTRANLGVEVVRAYWGAVLADARVATLVAADQAGQSHQKQAESLVRQGMATGSDALLAAVKAGEIRAQLLSARSEARLARRGLAFLMGQPDDTSFTLPPGLPLPADTSSIPAAEPRADVRAAAFVRDAAAANASRSSARFLPRLNGFGRFDWNTEATPFGGRSAWTLGVMVTWSPFSGGAELAERRETRARRDAARAAAEAAIARAGLEAVQADERLAVALARLEIATAAVRQAEEAHRIVSRKYDGGLATVTELFDAAAAQTSSELSRSAAGYDALVARADLDRATGREIES